MAEESKQPQAEESEKGPAPDAPASAPSESANTGVAEEPAPAEELTLEEAQGWVGFKLDDLGGSGAGKVEGVYVDDSTGRPEWLLARMGRFGHYCLIPARDAVAASGHVWVPYSRDQIRKAPRIDKNKPLERGTETALLEHYGIAAGDTGRGADLAGKDAAAITARPA